MKPNSQLIDFLKPYDRSIQALALSLRKVVTNLVPEANELIWDNYNAVSIAYSKSEQLKDAFCHIAIYSKHVNFGFNRGAELSSKVLNLEGRGKLIRHQKVTDMNSFPIDEIEKLLHQAYTLADMRNAELIEKKSLGKSIVMSISKKKIRP